MQGYIDRIAEKQGKGRNGPYTMYNLQVNGEWLGHGFTKPNAKEGDYISFDVEQKGQYKNITNVVVIPAPSKSSSGGSSSQEYVPPTNKRDVSIAYQSSRKDALQFLDTMLQHDAIKLPAKADAKYDAALAILQELTNKFYLDLEDVVNAGGVTLEEYIPSPNPEE